LGANIGIIEDLYLRNVGEGQYFLSALPLNIKGSEASPVRAVLIEK
jgi:polyketide cyclase